MINFITLRNLESTFITKTYFYFRAKHSVFKCMSHISTQLLPSDLPCTQNTDVYSVLCHCVYIQVRTKDRKFNRIKWMLLRVELQDIRPFPVHKIRVYRILDSFLLIWRAQIINYAVERRINKNQKRGPCKWQNSHYAVTVGLTSQWERCPTAQTTETAAFIESVQVKPLYTNWKWKWCCWNKRFYQLKGTILLNVCASIITVRCL